MTDDTRVICRRCGFENNRADQFCGSCGAFLEWEGQVAAATDGVATDGLAPVDPETASLGALAGGPVVARPGQGAPAAPGSAPGTTVSASQAPTQPWQAAAGPAPGGAGAGLVRCPACGIANPATRTFCQSCGETLTGATRYAERSAAEIAAALATAPGPVSTSPVPPAPPGAAATRQAEPRSRGIPGWLIAVAGLGIVAGIAIVAGATLLQGEGPASGASTAPGTPPVSTPAAAGGSGGPEGSVVPGSSGGPVEATTLALTGTTASSVVGDRAKFQPEKAIDGDLATCWQEGSAKEKGQWIEVSFAPSRADTLVIRNGHQASNALYSGNLRLKDVLISVNGGKATKVRLADAKRAQTIDLGGVSGATTIRVTIVSTYRSKKTAVAGTPFDDAAISEIKVIGVAGG